MNVIQLLTHKRTSSFSHECILLPSYVYNMHQDTKSARLIVVCKRTFKHAAPSCIILLEMDFRVLSALPDWTDESDLMLSSYLTGGPYTLYESGYFM